MKLSKVLKLKTPIFSHWSGNIIYLAKNKEEKQLGITTVGIELPKWLIDAVDAANDEVVSLCSIVRGDK